MCLAFSPQPVTGHTSNVDSVISNICIIVGEKYVKAARVPVKLAESGYRFGWNIVYLI